MFRHFKFFGSASAVALLSTFGHAAHAQSTDAPPTSGSVEEIVVTGSRIARRDMGSNSPITTLDRETMTKAAQPNLSAALSRLPQLNPTGGGALNLRGLGTARTLTLLNGQRLPSSNTNIIPSALVQNVEIITGGASAVYGSDAISGVVNFILRKDFNGVQMSVEQGSTDKGLKDRTASVTFGSDFNEGRGNAVFYYEWAHQDTNKLTDEDYTIGAFRQSSLPEGEVTFGANLPSQAAYNQVFQGYGIVPGTVRQGSRVSFNSDNTLYSNGLGVFNRKPYTDRSVSLGEYVVGSTALLYDTRAFRTLRPETSRQNLFTRADYKFTDNTSGYFQFLFARLTGANYLNPTPASGTFGYTIPVSNPFLPADLRTLLAARPNPAADFTFGKSTDELGARCSTCSTQYTYQAVAGLDGKLPVKDWSWAGSVVYGRVDNTDVSTNYFSLQALSRLLYASDGGKSLCEGGYNPFGYTRLSQACRTFIQRNPKNTQVSEQYIAEASVQGGLIDLPAGELRFAAGADFRRDVVSSDVDSAVQAGDIPFISGVSSRGSDSVKEVFGELAVPVLKDLPLIQKLDVDLGYRYSNYRSAGGVNTYKVDASWQVADVLRFRGGYERAIRAPTPSQLTDPAFRGTDRSFGTPPAAGDPCDIRSSFRNGPAASQVRALCAAQGMPAIFLDSYQTGQATFVVTSGGNPNLKPEVGDTYSVGAVLRSPFSNPWAQRLDLSVDYFNIALDGAIGTITGPQVLNLCFNGNGTANTALSNSNNFCQQVRRDPGTGDISNIDVFLFNLGGYKTTGIDTQVNWRLPLGEVGLSDRWGQINVRAVATRLLSYELQNRPGDPFLDYAGTIGNAQVASGGVTKPHWRALMSVNYDVGPANLGLTWRYIGNQQASTNIGAATRAQGVHAVSYVDLNLAYKLTDRLTVFGAVNNLVDLAPQIYPAGSGSADGSTYDQLGRRYVLRLTAKF